MNPISSPQLPVCWSIAGTDPSAGAGIQADLKTFQGLGVYGCTVITAVIAQNTQGVREIQGVSPSLVTAQLETLAADNEPAAVKVGMLHNAETVRAVAAALKPVKTWVVCDPVIASTSGAALLHNAGVVALQESLLPIVDLLTPNLPECERLLGERLRGPTDMPGAAAKLLALGPRSVLIKGGHADGARSLDFWSNGKAHAWISHPRMETPHTHGGGCTLSSAIAAAKATGLSDLDAIVVGRAYVNQGLRIGVPVGKGRRPLAHLGWPCDPTDLPVITDTPSSDEMTPSFPTPAPIGLYTIVDRAAWVKRLLMLGVKTVQIRCKDLCGDALAAEIRRAIELGRRYDAQVYINDHWQLALQHGAYGVHLGQDDLAGTDLAALRAAGLRLGISTHGYAEIARAMAVRPSYLAIGTLFHSPSKSFAHAPLGLPAFERLRRLVSIPVVAIGGITVASVTAVRAAGADGLAVISDVTLAPDLAARIREWNAALAQ